MYIDNSALMSTDTYYAIYFSPDKLAQSGLLRTPGSLRTPQGLLKESLGMCGRV